jgi:lipoate-protein ligase A
LLLESGAGAADFNMALDEALLESVNALARPVLRFYDWRSPAATFGYFQHYRDLEKITSLRPLLRRPTGGGLVPHQGDWTYSITVPVSHRWYDLTARESYQHLHLWLQAAFARVEAVTEVAPSCRKAGVGQCFVGHEQYDLLWQGRKIAGAAQRRNKCGLLIQGSVQGLLPPVARADWEAAMRRVPCFPGAETAWDVLNVSETSLERVEQLQREKYSQAGYNQRR